jgi:hypothetical protein
MFRKHGCWWAVLTLCLAIPQVANAGPYLGDWSWLWHPCRDCPRGEYSPLHYWTVGLYKTRAVVHPSSLDQYSPGPSPAPTVEYLRTPYPCRTTPSAPTSPYADPAAYFGRPTSLPFALP